MTGLRGDGFAQGLERYRELFAENGTAEIVFRINKVLAELKSQGATVSLFISDEQRKANAKYVPDFPTNFRMTLHAANVMRELHVPTVDNVDGEIRLAFDDYSPTERLEVYRLFDEAELQRFKEALIDYICLENVLNDLVTPDYKPVAPQPLPRVAPQSMTVSSRIKPAQVGTGTSSGGQQDT